MVYISDSTTQAELLTMKADLMFEKAIEHDCRSSETTAAQMKMLTATQEAQSQPLMLDTGRPMQSVISGQAERYQRNQHSVPVQKVQNKASHITRTTDMPSDVARLSALSM